MSSAALLTETEDLVDPPFESMDVPGGLIPGHVAHHVISGTSALGLGVFIERGAGFVANILAARFAGASTFGAYSLGISTANNISTYAAGGIGATATRFSGKYPYGSAGYPTLARALTIVSLVSAILAAGALWLGAAPIAHLLHKASLTGLLQWASLSAAGIILLECARGFFVGQRRLAALVLLSLVVGFGMVSLLPLAAASHKPIHMIVSQGVITLTAVTVCLLLAGPLKLFASLAGARALPLGPLLREIWAFGFIQLAGLIGANLSGWWLTALVARGDTTLVQMGFFAIASQLRNLVGVAPGLLTEGSYAVMADPSGEHLRTPHNVMAVCTFASTTTALCLAAVGMILAPWALLKLYGQHYTGAALTAATGLAIAVVHMGNAPAAARLSIVSIRATGLINTAWAVLVAGSATLLMLHGGGATLAMAIFFGAHFIAATLVLLVLSRKDFLPAGMVPMFLLSSGAIVLLALLALVRDRQPPQSIAWSMAMLLTLVGAVTGLYFLGKKHSWLPTAAAMRKLSATLHSALQRITASRKQRSSHGV